jgi:glycosyltransferase involved in cell wall biosynthesis
VLDEHNVESAMLFEAAWSTPRAWHRTLIAAQCAWHERRFCQLADEVIATSDIDAAKLRKLAPHAHVTVIPNSVDAEAYASARSTPGATLFFSGTLNYAPNVEGLDWFIDEILPRLRGSLKAELPRVVVAGANPSPETRQKLERAGIHVEADPPKMLPHLAQASVVFVPLRSGSGTRLKILEAMAAGKPVVSTGKGAEGILVSPGQDLFIADQPDTFASLVARLLRDPTLRATIGVKAAQLVESRYDWRQARGAIAGLLG